LGVCQGGDGLAGFSLLLVYAAQHTTAANLGIMQGVIPAVVIFLGWLTHRTYIGWSQFFGLCSLLTGILVLISTGSLVTILAFRFNLGDLLMVAACLCYGAYKVALAKWLKMPPVLLLFFSPFVLF
jgi:drug/metabolite transporter (DMT)-like permease